MPANHKNYAHSQSFAKPLTRLPNLGLLILLLLLSISPDSEAQITLDEIQDTLNRVSDHSIEEVMIKAADLNNPKLSRITIKKSLIENAPVQTMNELLRYPAIIDIRQRGPFASQADLGIKGGTYDQSQVFLNGINISDPQTGHHNLAFFTDVETFDRVEISDGPEAILTGSNSLTGSINIITGETRSEGLRISVMAGQHSLNKLAIAASDTTRNLSHYLNLSRISSSGYIKNTDFKSINAFYQAKFDHKRGSSDLQAGFGSREFGANSFYSLKYPSQFEAINTGFLSLRYQSNTRIKYSPAFYFRGNTDRFELKRNNDSIPFNYHKTYITGFMIRLGAEHSSGNTNLIFNLRNEQILSNVLGNNLKSPVRVTGSAEEYYTKTYSRLNTSITATHSITWKPITFNGGVMAYYNNDPGRSGIGIYPSINASLGLNDKMSFIISAGKTMRMPTFTDLFYRSPVQQGNRFLKPEKALSIDAGFNYKTSVTTAGLSVFRRKGSDLIDWVKHPSPDSIVWRSMNHSGIVFSGIEGSLTITPDELSLLRRIKTFSISYACLNTGVKSSEMLSKYAFDYLNHKISSAIDLLLFFDVHYFTTISWQDRNSVFQDISGVIRSYEPFWLCDMKLLKKISNFTLYAEASNVFSKNYHDFGGLLQPGRWFRTGIIMELKR